MDLTNFENINNVNDINNYNSGGIFDNITEIIKNNDKVFKIIVVVIILIMGMYFYQGNYEKNKEGYTVIRGRVGNYAYVPTYEPAWLYNNWAFYSPYRRNLWPYWYPYNYRYGRHFYKNYPTYTRYLNYW